VNKCKRKGQGFHTLTLLALVPISF
jgi:hypothetical protein